MSKSTRRNFLLQSSGALAVGLAGAGVAGNGLASSLRAQAGGGQTAPAAASTGGGKTPYDYVIVEGHRDIWEFNDRNRLDRKSKLSMLKDHLMPRLLEGGVTMTVLPAGGDSVAERGDDPRLLEGSLRVLDQMLIEIEKTNGAAILVRTKADLPTRPDKTKVRIFLDIEGGASIQVQEPEPAFHPDRKMAMLRHFFRLGVRGMQLTHDARNMIGVGTAEPQPGHQLSEFGIEVIHEMNRLGMVIGVSHLSAAGIAHVAKLTKQPIMSTHTNPRVAGYKEHERQHLDEDLKAIASTGGVIGTRYILEDAATYEQLADEIAYIHKMAGENAPAIGWLGHDNLSTRAVLPGELPETRKRKPSGIQAETMYQHWDNFIRALRKKNFTETQMEKILGGNFLRVMREVIPA